MVKKENYVTIQGWMVTDLKLTGNELMVYAIIYGFCQTENQEFTGSANYLAERCGATKRYILTILQKLCDKKLICKHDFFVNGVKFVKYTLNDSLQSSEVVKKVHQGDVQSTPGGGVQSTPNNIVYNNIEYSTSTIGVEQGSETKKTIKGEELKNNWFDDCEHIWLTQGQYDKLLLKYANKDFQLLKKKVYALEAVLANGNKKYKDHYRTLINRLGNKNF